MLVFLGGFAAGAAVSAAVSIWIFRRRTQMMGRFFSFAAHEINSPITAINMTILNLCGGVFGKVGDEHLKWMEMMREQVGRLNGMVGELRDMIHLQLRRDLITHIEDVPAEDVIHAALGGVRTGFAQAGVAVELELAEGLPNVRVDRDRAIRTLTSLLFHCRKFRSGGDLKVSALPRAGMVVVSLEYRGPRLSAAEVRDSLDVFYPALQRQDHVLSATGLGLGVLKTLIELQGGRLTFEVRDGLTSLALFLPEVPR
ncbi:MAG: HAMP domain-containing sensor histidine kinase [Elusimicrobiota bacterium]